MPTAAQAHARHVCLVASALVTLVLAVGAVRIDYPLERALWLTRATGYAAMGALFSSLAMTPLHRLAGRLLGRTPAKARWLALRRMLGITAALWGIAHASLSLGTTFDDAWPAVLAWPHARSGAATLAILLPLLVTSFPRVLGSLRLRLWTHLHRLVYLAPVFLFLHLVQSPFAPRRLTLVWFAVLVAVSLLRLLPVRRRTPRDDATGAASEGESMPSPAA